ncbi:MAG: glutamine synthetase family protein [Candidatus Thorarchaeota archaeon]|jgi:glutamine synthetase
MCKEHEQPEFLRLIFSDLLGHTRSIEVGYDRLEEVVNHGLVIDGSSVPGYATVNESDVILLPSRAIPISQSWDPSAAFLLCRIHEVSREPHPRDPRNILRKITARAAERGLKLMVGSELEFFIVARRSDNGIVPLDNGGYFSSQPEDFALDFRRDVIRTLNEIGIATTSHHHEVASGQQEIGLQYVEAQMAADNIMLSRIIISELAHRRGMIATFMPKPFQDQNGSGMHLHQSLWGLDGSRNLFATTGDSSISQLAMMYIGGLLEHATTLAAILAPTVNSYKRLVPGFEAPTRVAWGYRNRSTMVRVPHFNGSKRAARIELRSPDATSSPHLVIASILAAGLDGIERKIEPPQPTDKDLYESGVTLKSLPGTLEGALDSLEKSTMMREVLGDSVVDTLVTLRKREWKEYVESTGDPGSSEITEWEIERYMHVN